MRQFFKSARFKVAVGIVVLLAAIAIIVAVAGGAAAPQSNIIGSIVTPVQRFFAGIGDSLGDFFDGFEDTEALKEENEELRQELREKTSALLEYDKLKRRNEFLKDYMEIKDENPDWQFAEAMVIGEDPLDPFGSFMVDKGTLHGINKGDPVITADGLVGYIEEAGASYSTVTTILSPDAQVGSYDNKTRDAGVIEGEAGLAEDGNCRLSYLKKSAKVAVGDYIITSGVGGAFPDGIIVGEVVDMGQDAGQVSVYAVVRPQARLEELKDIMVITAFEGQGSLDETMEDGG